MKNLPEAIRRVFPQKRVVIVGDLVADQFLRGTIARVSREAPVFILRHDETETLAGAAANAAVNVASLGGTPILIGLTGKDVNGGLLRQRLTNSGVGCDLVIEHEGLQTTTKIRVLAGQHYAARQQVIRIDYENRVEIGDEIRTKLVQNLVDAGQTADAIIISDYNYGVAFPEIAEAAKQISKQRDIPLLIDSRFRLNDFRGATSATPNQDEVEQILGKDFTQNDCLALCTELGYASLLVTRGNQGMLLVEPGREPVHIDAVGSSEPVDVTGAGDTVIAAYALGLASGLSFLDAANLANHAGGIVVMKKGTASATAEELFDSLNPNTPESARSSVL
jgi:D-glycero-beta-D-manno-heptose-7-phosphate kinase